MAQNLFDTLTATIANGASLSDVVALRQRHVVGIIMPAGWTAAALTLQGSADGLNFFSMYDFSGVELSITVAAGRYIYLPPNAMTGLQAVKLRSGTSAAAISQGADRVITLVVRPYA